MIRTLVKLRTQHKEFSDVSNFKVLADGYPFVYERTVAEKKFLIALNPAAEEKVYDISGIGKVIVNHSVQICENALYMGGISCLVAEML